MNPVYLRLILSKILIFLWFLRAVNDHNIAYSALTALVTKNSKERVQIGSCRFIFAFSTSLLIQSVTVGAVAAFGGGASGWRTVAVIYAVIGLVVNTISVLNECGAGKCEFEKNGIESHKISGSVSYIGYQG